jgi:hypothetical protein
MAPLLFMQAPELLLTQAQCSVACCRYRLFDHTKAGIQIFCIFSDVARGGDMGEF